MFLHAYPPIPLASVYIIFFSFTPFFSFLRFYTSGSALTYTGLILCTREGKIDIHREDYRVTLRTLLAAI